LLISNISSRVRSRDSIEDKSKSSSFLFPKIFSAVGEVGEVGEVDEVVHGDDVEERVVVGDEMVNALVDVIRMMQANRILKRRVMIVCLLVLLDRGYEVVATAVIVIQCDVEYR